MITVAELIENLRKEDQKAIVLLDGYEYDMEYLRLQKLKKGKFKLPKGSDLGMDGGRIKKDDKGDFSFLLLGRST